MGSGDLVGATPPQVAALLRARTKDNEGREVGLWTEATRPTLGQVEELIDLARGQVEGSYGITEACRQGFERLVALRAAQLVELSFFPEQIRSDRSPYPYLENMFNQALDGYQACIEQNPDDISKGTVYSVFTPSMPRAQLPKQVVNWNPSGDDLEYPPNPPWWPPVS